MAFGALEHEFHLNTGRVSLGRRIPQAWRSAARLTWPASPQTWCAVSRMVLSGVLYRFAPALPATPAALLAADPATHRSVDEHPAPHFG